MHVSETVYLVCMPHAQVTEISKERFRLAAELEALQGVRARILLQSNLPLCAFVP